jgi:hypothetical protein
MYASLYNSTKWAKNSVHEHSLCLHNIVGVSRMANCNVHSGSVPWKNKLVIGTSADLEQDMLRHNNFEHGGDPSLNPILELLGML